MDQGLMLQHSGQRHGALFCRREGRSLQLDEKRDEREEEEMTEHQCFQKRNRHQKSADFFFFKSPERSMSEGAVVRP